MEALSIYLQENMHMESICVFPTGGLAQKYRPCRTASGMNNPVPVSLLSGDRGSSAIIRFGSFSMIRYIV
ncbi:hypothetical protein DW061_21985 [Ruminococcus sp. AF42-9BH]|nr:hypothetical protein DW061_21985 [Ruminococcus sp. AF42-9BH]